MHLLAHDRTTACLTDLGQQVLLTRAHYNLVGNSDYITDADGFHMSPALRSLDQLAGPQGAFEVRIRDYFDSSRLQGS